jgi:hypothetical protein
MATKITVALENMAPMVWPASSVAKGRTSPAGPAKVRTSGKARQGPVSLRVGALGRFTDAVFVSDEMLLDMGFGAARAGFARLPCGGLLLTASEDAYGQGTKSLPVAWPPGRVPGLSRLAGVRFRELAASEDSAGLALRWDVLAPGRGLFPALDANLTLAQAGEQASLLALAGTYRLPAAVLPAAPGTVIAGLAAATTRGSSPASPRASPALL